MLSNEIVMFALVLMVVLIVGYIYFTTQSARTTREQLRRVSAQHTLIHADKRARDLCLAIHQLHPMLHAGIDFMIRQDSPDQDPYLADWNATTPKPTAAQLDAALSRIANKDLAALRRAEYPSVEEQLDAAYKARQGDNSAQLQIDAKIKAVKEKYQKPGESTP
jgi:hypothetical protein